MSCNRGAGIGFFVLVCLSVPLLNVNQGQCNPCMYLTTMIEDGVLWQVRSTHTSAVSCARDGRYANGCQQQMRLGKMAPLLLLTCSTPSLYISVKCTKQ